MTTSFHGPIFRGCYADFSAVPQQGAGFLSERWIAAVRAQTIATIKKTPSPAAPLLARSPSLLPLLAATIARYQGAVCIVDIGGGMGTGYAAVRAQLIDPRAVDYHIVENATLCAEGRALWPHDIWLQFHTTIPTGRMDIDLVYLGSCLQYVEDWQELLSVIVKLQPRYLLLDDLPLIDAATSCTTAQQYYDSLLPLWFFSRADLLHTVQSQQFRLVDERACSEYSCVPPSLQLFHNIPATHQPTGSRQLVLAYQPPPREE